MGGERGNWEAGKKSKRKSRKETPGPENPCQYLIESSAERGLKVARELFADFGVRNQGRRFVYMSCCLGNLEGLPKERVRETARSRAA